MGKNPEKREFDANELNSAIRLACQRNFGVLDTSFLCQSLSILAPRVPLCVDEDETIGAVMKHLKENRVGCVLIVDKSRKLRGIFSERDAVLKVFGEVSDFNRPISDFMTADPVAELPETTIAYALNLMSLGGFRHLPVIDQDRMPVGIVSVKDVVDFIVTSFTDDLLNFETGPSASP